ncbi:MAG: 3-methyl-2-oxobutanoate hydroxymethyltransferase [Candidatus Omnitrophica bacterium]|nr:3-methyl-2-oxobutanoate hydroxymethyltransferase [Candidatus Omnitrophota bacterium]
MRLTVKDIIDKKKKHEKITALTAYDALFAKLEEEAGVDILLVGDSLGMVLLGLPSTRPVSLAQMMHHLKAVSRVSHKSLIVADMPYGTYEGSPERAVKNALSLIKEGGAHAVKLEGGREEAKTISALVASKIPVMGHLGLTPQSVEFFGGYKIQGRSTRDARKIFADARLLAGLGVFSLVLECVPKNLASKITQSVRVPTIGIGAGTGCDGQVLVVTDLLGMGEGRQYRFVREYATLRPVMLAAIRSYIEDVHSGKFPGRKESFE